MIEDYERRWRSLGDAVVCDTCCSEPFLQSVIRGSGIAGRCSYCNKHRAKVISADEIMTLIGDGLRSGWGDPLEEMAWDAEEGRYWGSEPMSQQEVLWDAGFEGSDEFTDAVADALTLEEWSRKSPYNLSPHEVLIAGWEDFELLVKHDTRYLFLEAGLNDTSLNPDSISPAGMLDELGKAVIDAGLVRRLGEGSRIVRGRAHPAGISPSGVSELGPPPLEKAIYSNRMSPAGIVMFYGSLDVETARAEAAREGHVVSTAEFELLRGIEILDFTEIPPVPSIFDPESRHKLSSIRFMHEFAKELSKPVALDGREHIEYVPTQVVTEYLRKIFSKRQGVSIEGILYQSSRGKGISCVLFAAAENCGTLPIQNSREEVWLGLDDQTVCHP